jgi:hypothetical protein
MMRKDVSGGWEVKIQKIRKNDEKRRFRRSKVKVKKSEKMMRKDFQEVERSKIKKSEKMMRKDVSRSQRSKFKKSVSCWMLWKMKKIKEIMMRCDSVEKFCFFIDALAHSPISAHSLISDSKRHHNSQLKFFFWSTP